MNNALPLTVCVLQFSHTWGAKSGALARLEQAVSELRGVDLVLLPELAFSGYVSPDGDTDVRPFAETLEGPTCRAVARLAARFQLAIAAPLAECDAGSYYNALVLFDETGAPIGHWRKRHPWFPERWATPGNLGTPVIDWRGIRIAAAICFDLHFLAEEAADELESADLFLFPSAWVESGRDSRVPLLQGLARRFGLTVLNANWARSVPQVPGQGGSVIFDPQGNPLARAQDDLPCALTAACVAKS